MNKLLSSNACISLLEFLDHNSFNNLYKTYDKNDIIKNNLTNYYLYDTYTNNYKKCNMYNKHKGKIIKCKKYIVDFSNFIDYEIQFKIIDVRNLYITMYVLDIKECLDKILMENNNNTNEYTDSQLLEISKYINKYNDMLEYRLEAIFTLNKNTIKHFIYNPFDNAHILNNKSCSILNNKYISNTKYINCIEDQSNFINKLEYLETLHILDTNYFIFKNLNLQYLSLLTINIDKNFNCEDLIGTSLPNLQKLILIVKNSINIEKLNINSLDKLEITHYDNWDYYCYNINNLNIKSLNLKKITITGANFINSCNLYLPNLTYLNISYCAGNIEIEQMVIPNLTELYLCDVCKIDKIDGINFSNLKS